MSSLRLSLIILTIGLLLRVFITWDGNFIFNVDNADDMIDVREMVSLGKPKLIGQIAGGVEGLFYGPGWFYLLTIPYILFNGDPYGAILMEIVLWAIGGFFLLKLVSKWGKLAIIVAGSIWVASDYILLSTKLALNPNPVLFLTPLLIFLLEKYIQTAKFRYVAGSFFLGGFFFNCEMAFGLFVPFIIIFTTLFLNKKLLKTSAFWIGGLMFLLWILPQVWFDLRHDFLLTKAIWHHLSESSFSEKYGLLIRLNNIINAYYIAISATLMNYKIFVITIMFAVVVSLVKSFKEDVIFKKNPVLIIVLIIIVIPFIGKVVSPATVMLWHLIGLVAVIPILLAFVVYKMTKQGGNLYLLAILLTFWVVILAGKTMNREIRYSIGVNTDPSVFKNEIKAIDFVYKRVEGMNFKLYTYTPSVYDYPYQYLIWWYGQRKYHYLPKDYAYLPNKPAYISNKNRFTSKFYPAKDSNLVFLIKEPDYPDRRKLWENNFQDLVLVDKENFGGIEIEIREEKSPVGSSGKNGR